MPFAENLGTGGGSLDAQYGSSAVANTNAPLLLDPRTSGNFVYTPGTAGNYVAVPHSPSLNILGTEGTPFLSLPGPGLLTQHTETPDQPDLDITGDIDVRVDLATDDWSEDSALLSKFGLAGNHSWTFRKVSTGALRFGWSTNGTNFLNATSTSVVPFADGQRGSVRATLDVDNAGQYQVSFFTSTDFVNWTPLGSVVNGTTGPTSIFNGDRPVRVGADISAFNTGGKFYRAQIRNGINGPAVFDADFTQQALGSRGFIESTGKLVSLVGNAAQIVDGTTYGFAPGTSGAYWSAPDSTPLDITGNIDVRVRVSLNNWASSCAFMGKGYGNAYYFYLAASGAFIGFASTIGGVTTFPALAFTPPTNGSTVWLRATRISSTGVVTFFQAPDSEAMPTTWTTLGTATGTAGAIDNSTQPLGIAAAGAGFEPMTGRMFRTQIRSGVDGTVAFDADFSRQFQFASTFSEGSANLATVTTQGAARIERDRDLDLRVRVALDDWTPATQNLLISKSLGASTSYSWSLEVSPTSTLVLRYGLTPTTRIDRGSTAPLVAVDGQPLWLRVTVDVNNGANGNTVTFFQAPDSDTMPTTWTTIGTPVVTVGTTGLAPTTEPVLIGGENTAVAANASGKFYAVQVLNGINGSPVLDLDFTDAITTGSETFLPDTVDEVIPEALQFLPNLGWGGTALNARFGSAVGADTNDPLLLTHTGTNYLYLPGGSNWAALPDTNFAGSGDVSIRMRVAIDWTTTSFGALIGNTNQTSTGFRFGTGNGARRLQLSWWDSGTASFRSLTADSDNPFAASTLAWVRVDLDRDTGAGCAATFYVAPDATNEPTAWAQVGSVITSATVANLAFAALGQQLGIGSQKGDSAANTLAGSYYRAIIYTDLTQTTKSLDVDFTTGVTSGAQATFTATVGGTVTINRSTSGRKSVAVVQDVLLFGTDDYLEVPDNDLLDFGATDSFTVMSAQRTWSNTVDNFFVTKKASRNLATDVGWGLQRGTNGVVRGFYADGVNVDTNVIGPTPVAAGTMSTVALVDDHIAQTWTAYDGGTAGTPEANIATGSLANTLAMQVGRIPGTFTDMEFRGSAIWRRALTAAEVALVNAHYTTGPTTASTALMRQAVWWIDAGTRSVAQINRSTSGRKSVACARCTWLLGTDDYFQVAPSDLFSFDQGDDFTLLVLHRGWWEQGTNDTLLSTTSSTTTSAAGWAMSNSAGDPWTADGRIGDGSLGVAASAPRRNIGTLTATWLERDTLLDRLTAYTNSTAGTPVTDTTVGMIGNTNGLRLGRLATTGSEYLDAEVLAAVVWRRKLTTDERNAVLAYYGVS